ncbi:MAG: tetratricopeptide repeat protein [Cyanobacteria bacterium J06621_8]
MCLIFLGGIIGISLSLKTRYAQWQELQDLSQANDLASQGQHGEAIAVYNRLIQANPQQSHLIWINRGYTWLGLEQYEEVLHSCSAATVIRPQNPLGWNCRGEALHYLGRNQRALQALDKAIAINPRNPTFWLNQSSVLRELNKHRQAIAASKEASKLLLESQSPDSEVKSQLALAFNHQGQVWLELGQNKRALEAFEQSLEQVADSLPALQGAGMASYQLGDYDGAVKLFTEALQQDNLTVEQQAINWLYQGISFCAVNQVNEASQAFKQVLRLSTNPQYQKLAQAGCGIQ